VGGANPGSFAGFQLAAGSLGKSSASDGADRGARVLDWPRVGGNAAPPASPAAGGGGGGNARSGSRRLVAAYAFDERSGRRVQDASGHGRWGVIHGAGRVKGRSGRALAFDGRGDFVSIGDARALDLHKRMTLEAWVRPRGQLSRRPVIAKKFGRRVAYGLYAGDHRGRPAASASKRVVRARNRLRRNRWSHLAVTFNGRQVRLFVNGKQVRHQPRRRALRASHGQLRIGGGVAGPSFKGLIDDVRVYRRALGRQAIKRDMRAAI
jgi:hypothetical protein